MGTMRGQFALGFGVTAAGAVRYPLCCRWSHPTDLLLALARFSQGYRRVFKDDVTKEEDGDEDAVCVDGSDQEGTKSRCDSDAGEHVARCSKYREVVGRASG